MVKWLSGAVVILAMAYGGFWYWASAQAERATLEAVEAAREAGWQIETSSPPELRGFPSRFDTLFRDVDVITPNGLRWQAPELRAFALAYRPTEAIVIWPDRQSVDWGAGPLTVGASDMRASLVVAPSSEFELDRATWSTETLFLDALAGQTLRVSSALAAIRETPGTELSYDLYLTLDRLAYDSVLVDAAEGNAQITVSRQIDRQLLSDRPGIEAITLDDLIITMGSGTINLSGAVTVDESGQLSGEIELAATNWRGVVDQLEDADLIDWGDGDAFIRSLSGSDAVAVTPMRMRIRFALRRGNLTINGFPVANIPALPELFQRQ